MVATLLPISSAPISRCLFSRSRVTIEASRLPSLASCSIVPRDDAVMAVSLPEKKNARNRQNKTATTIRQSESNIVCQASPQQRRAAPPDRRRAEYKQPPYILESR